MFNIIFSTIIILYVFAFTDYGFKFYSAIKLGALHSAAVANPSIIVFILFSVYLIFDRSGVVLFLFFVLLLTATITQSPVLNTYGVFNTNAEPVLKIVTANMLFNSDKVDEDLTMIMENNPDVIVLQEFNVNNMSEETAAVLEEKYPHFLHTMGTPTTVDGGTAEYEYADKEHRLGLSVYSKYVLTDVMSNGRLYQTVRLTKNNETFNIVNIHTVSPVTVLRHQAWLDSFMQVENVLTFLENNSFDGVTVLAGDFNANHNHAPFRNMVIGNSLHQSGSQTPTWGKNPGGKIKLFKLDHVLTSSNAYPDNVRRIILQGSDHAGLVADIVLTK